jgi:hypothetical protein
MTVGYDADFHALHFGVEEAGAGPRRPGFGIATIAIYNRILGAIGGPGVYNHVGGG